MTAAGLYTVTKVLYWLRYIEMQKAYRGRMWVSSRSNNCRR